MNIPEFLHRNNVRFDVLEHSDTYDAQRMAHAVHVSGHQVAKTVLLRTDGPEYVIAVLPASHNIDLDKVASELSVGHVSLATEVEIAERCPDCEFGALPPFGSQYATKTVFDELLNEDEEIVFEGTSHHESIRMNRADFVALEKPLIASFCS